MPAHYAWYQYAEMKIHILYICIHTHTHKKRILRAHFSFKSIHLVHVFTLMITCRQRNQIKTYTILKSWKWSVDIFFKLSFLHFYLFLRKHNNNNNKKHHLLKFLCCRFDCKLKFKKCHKAILLLTDDFSARCEHKRNWIKMQSKTRRNQRPHSLTSGHEKVVWVEQLKTEQSENAFHRERPSVHKVSIEQLEVVSRKLSTLAKHQNQHKTDLYVLQCWTYFSHMKQAQWTPTPLPTPTTLAHSK